MGWTDNIGWGDLVVPGSTAGSQYLHGAANKDQANPTDAETLGLTRGTANDGARGGLGQNAQGANEFAGWSQDNFGQSTRDLRASQDALRAQAAGQNSVSAEQLRQGLQQNLAAQQSMAAGASSNNQAMAARTAMMQQGRLGAGLAGQQSVAGLQERQQAQQALSQSLLGSRGQDLQGVLGGYGASNQAYGAQISPNGDKSGIEKNGPAIMGLLGGLMSDKRIKTDIEDGDVKARRLLEGLKSYNYRYKDEKFGEGDQLGIMAQDLEAAGLGNAVTDTPQGKRVDGAKLAAGLASTLPGLNKRLKALEGGAK